MTDTYAPCPDCGIDHPKGTRHRVSIAQQRARERLRGAAWRSGVRVGRGRPASEAAMRATPQDNTIRTWEVEQAHRGASADAEAVSFARTLLNDPCSYCGGREVVGIDHIVTISAGGKTRANNLTAACRSCNAVKRDRSLLQAVARIAYRRWRSEQTKGEVA